MRWLGVDLGDARTGLAVGDDDTCFVQPVETLEVPRRGDGEALVTAVVDAMHRYETDGFVIGLPLNMDDSEGPRAVIARTFGAALAAAAPAETPVEFVDERLSSHAADGRMAQSGRTHRQKKKIRDALAAAEILRDFLGTA